MKETLADRIRHYKALIPPVFSGSFPKGFKLEPADWIIPESIVNRPPVRAHVQGYTQDIRPISTLDVEFLDTNIVYLARHGVVDLVKDYPCGLNCPGCFSEESIFGDRERLLYPSDIFGVIGDARKIGLYSIKFLGPGELFQNRDLFAILDNCESMGLPISIFTKGAELGDDDLARYNFGHLGIRSAKNLVDRVAQYRCARILLGFNSFFPERQDAMVGSKADSVGYSQVDGVFQNRGVANYTAKRDRALVNLVEAGFNQRDDGQHLTLVMTPLLRNQLDEVAEVYAWAAHRNMPVVIAPTMESGQKAQRLVQINQAADPQNAWIADAFVKVYSRAIDEGIITLDELRRKGPSAYIGIEACNQVANGLFLRLNGQVKICPGSSAEHHIFANVHDKSIADIWYESPSYALGPQMNNWCAAKTHGLPSQLQDQVMRALEARYN